MADSSGPSIAVLDASVAVSQLADKTHRNQYRGIYFSKLWGKLVIEISWFTARVRNCPCCLPEELVELGSGLTPVCLEGKLFYCTAEYIYFQVCAQKSSKTVLK